MLATWRERRRRPMQRREILANRLTYLACAVVIPVTLALAPAMSLWHALAVGAASGLLVPTAMIGRYQLLQLLSLRPPSGKDAVPGAPGGSRRHRQAVGKAPAP